MTRLVSIATTTETKVEAENIAKELVEKRMVCCAQISGPITSYYHWDGKVAQSDEFVLTVKTIENSTESVKTAIMASHPYDVPEIIGQVIDNVSEKYLEWAIGEIKP